MNMFTSSRSRVLQEASDVDASDVAESAEKRARRERIMAAMRPKACSAAPKSTSKPTSVQRSPTSPIKFSPDDEEFMLTHVSSAGVSSAEARANICIRARKPRMTCEMIHLFIWRFWRTMPQYKAGSYISVREAVEKTGSWIEPQNGKKLWSARIEGVHSHAPEGHLIGAVLAFWRYNVTVAAGYGQPSRAITVWDCELGEVTELIKNDGPGHLPALRALPPASISSLFATNPFTSKQGPLNFRLPSLSPEQRPRPPPTPEQRPAPPPVSKPFDRLMTEQQAKMHKACQERIMGEKEANTPAPRPSLAKSFSDRPRVSAAVASVQDRPSHHQRGHSGERFQGRLAEYPQRQTEDRRFNTYKPDVGDRLRPSSFVERGIEANQNVAPAIVAPSPISSDLASSLVALRSESSGQQRMTSADNTSQTARQDKVIKTAKRQRDILGPAAAQSPIAFSFEPEPEQSEQAEHHLPDRMPGARLKLTDLISEEPPTKRQRMRSDISICSVSSTESLGISTLEVNGEAMEVSRAADLLIQAAWSKRTSPNKQHYHLTSAVRNGTDVKAEKMRALEAN